MFTLGPAHPDTVIAWQDEAVCRTTDPEIFFPDKGESTREGKKVCARCPVKAECLEHALANEERFGVWGGLSERERRRIRYTRRGKDIPESLENSHDTMHTRRQA